MHLSLYRCTLLCCLSISAVAQVGQGPVNSSPPAPLPYLQDHDFHGEIRLHVDATDTDHGIFRVAETIPVQSPGDMVLLYPEWETTSHSATASVVELAGLHIQSGPHELAWRRDPFDVHAFHVLVPAGAQTLSVAFDYLPSAGAEIRPAMIDVRWQRMLLYPAGWYARDISVAASLELPVSFKAFTALAHKDDWKEDPATRNHQTLLSFASLPLDRLIDAPVYAGRYGRQLAISSSNTSPVNLDVLADGESDLVIDSSLFLPFQALIQQSEKLFGPAPFSHYEALVSLSDEFSPGGGQEHLEEGESNLPAHFFSDYAHQLNNRDLIAHEYVHAWNGRYRQPAGLWSANFNTPTDPSLLWVYEGQTEFWGRILAARSGMRNEQETLDKLAIDAALVANRPGREWKNLADSALDALYMPGHSLAWRDWQRREDYYPEGVILWLGVEARLRELSHGRAGLDDFAQTFFAAHRQPETTSTYTFEDVCAVLNAITASDWKAFLTESLSTHDTSVTMAGLERSGWRLAYSSTPSETFLQDQAESGVTDLSYSLGLQARDNGTLRAVVWNGPAFRAGLRPGIKIRTVNGQAFTSALLLSAVSASSSEPIRLSVQIGDNTRDVIVSYSGPLRYPKLMRISGAHDWLTPLLTPR